MSTKFSIKWIGVLQLLPLKRKVSIADRLAQLVERRTTVREVSRSSPSLQQGTAAVKTVFYIIFIVLFLGHKKSRKNRYT